MVLDKVKYWTELSDYDLVTADAMLRTGRWLYVGYMCHQVVEKIFKAYWSSRKEEPAPFSHNLINIEARYPSYKQSIGESLSEEKCKGLLAKTKEVQQWVKTML